MSNICKTVSLRTRKIKDGHMLSYYLDYYPGYRDESTMKVIRHESLGIYIYAKPKNQMEQKYNLNLTARAEAIRCRRFESIVNERYDFFDKEKMKGDFLAYFKKLADKKNSKWHHVYMHFRTFTQGKCTFGEINVDLCNRFREYLLTAPQGLHKNRKLHINSAANYWSTFRASIHTAYRDRKIKENPNGFLDRIECIPTIREHLSQEELIRLAETPCEEEVLKKAFLFACLTGLRKSDIRQLTWQQIQPYTNGRMFVTTRMQKTKEIVHNPISDEAYGLLGERGEGLIFEDFKDKMLQGPLQRWLTAAGITKKITFHCTRHSFGSLHVEMGTDMAVIQAYLGHKNITTTQIYSKIAAQQMCQVVDKITLKRKEA